MIRRKKSKYRHCVINKTKYYFYSIKWLDILGDAGHADTNEFSQMQPAKMITQAYIYKKTKKFLWTFASYDENEAQFSDRNVFPLGCIISMKKIEV